VLHGHLLAPYTVAFGTAVACGLAWITFATVVRRFDE